MDIKAEIEKLTASLKKDPDTMERFKKDPLATVKSLVGNVIPEDKLDEVVKAVKAKISTDKIGDAVQGILGKLGKDKD